MPDLIGIPALVKLSGIMLGKSGGVVVVPPPGTWFGAADRLRIATLDDSGQVDRISCGRPAAPKDHGHEVLRRVPPTNLPLAQREQFHGFSAARQRVAHSPDPQEIR